MSTEELLARLARLGARDRAWLLGELPPAMRRELAVLLAGEDESLAAAAEPAVATFGVWESLDPQRVAAILDPDPAWLVSAATRASDPRWRERLLAAMSSRRRHDVELADRAGGRLGARAAQWVLERCKERLSSGAGTPHTDAPRSGFAALVEQMKERFS